MKKCICAIAFCVLLCGCDLLGGDPLSGGGYTDKWASLVNETSHDVQLNGNTLTYGDHTYTLDGEISYDFQPGYYDPQVTATVQFSNIPSGYTEFKAVYENLLGKSLAGTVAMVPMAMEIYARKPSTGEKCLLLLCKDASCVDGITRELKRKFPQKREDESDEYCQRYLPAALLEGAVYDNAYAPNEPYTVEMGAAATQPQEAKLTPYGTVYYTYIFADAWDTSSRGVDVFLPKGQEYFKVQNCPGCYSQCKTIFGGPWTGLK